MENDDSLPIWVSFQLDSVNAQGGIFGVYNDEIASIRDWNGKATRISLKNRAEALL